jgi:hypothetical protein
LARRTAGYYVGKWQDRVLIDFREMNVILEVVSIGGNCASVVVNGANAPEAGALKPEGQSARTTEQIDEG